MFFSNLYDILCPEVAARRADALNFVKMLSGIKYLTYDGALRTHVLRIILSNHKKCNFMRIVIRRVF